MSPWVRAAGTNEDCMRMTSISSPLAVNSPQSLAARSGRAVMVKPALEILSLARRSWANPFETSNKRADRMSCQLEKFASLCHVLILVVKRLAEDRSHRARADARTVGDKPVERDDRH